MKQTSNRAIPVVRKNNQDIAKITNYLKDLKSRKFYGNINLIMSNGKVDHIKTEESIKVEDLKELE